MAMKYFIIIIGLVLTGCSYNVEYGRSGIGWSQISGTTEEHLGRLYDDVEGLEDDVYNKIMDSLDSLERKIKALEHEVTGVETGCRLEVKERCTEYDNMIVCPPCTRKCLVEGTVIETICKGDSITINPYQQTGSCMKVNNIPTC